METYNKLTKQELTDLIIKRSDLTVADTKMLMRDKKAQLIDRLTNLDVKQTKVADDVKPVEVSVTVDEVEALEDEVSNLNDEIIELGDDMVALNNDLNDIRMLNNDLEAELNNKKIEVMDIKANEAFVNNKLIQCVDDKEALKAEITELNDEIISLNDEITELEDVKQTKPENDVKDYTMLNTILSKIPTNKGLSKTEVWNIIQVVADDKALEILKPILAPKTNRNIANKQTNDAGLYMCRYTGLWWSKQFMVFSNPTKEIAGVSRGYSKLGIKIWNKHNNVIKALEKQLMLDVLAGDNVTKQIQVINQAKKGRNKSGYLMKEYLSEIIECLSELSEANYIKHSKELDDVKQPKELDDWQVVDKPNISWGFAD